MGSLPSQVRSAGGLVHFISPYDHIDVLQGQGTTIVEAAEQVANVWGAGAAPDVVLAPAGGGGLLSGVSVASKGYFKDVKVVAAEPAGASPSLQSRPAARLRAHAQLTLTSTVSARLGIAANDLHKTFYSSPQAWQPAVNPPATICDGLLTATGHMTWPTIARNVDAVLLADDRATIKAMKLVWERACRPPPSPSRV